MDDCRIIIKRPWITHQSDLNLDNRLPLAHGNPTNKLHNRPDKRCMLMPNKFLCETCRTLPNDRQRNCIHCHPRHQTHAWHLGRNEPCGDVARDTGAVAAVQLTEVAGKCSYSHNYQLSRQGDLQTVLVTLLDLFSCHCNLNLCVIQSFNPEY